MADTEKHIQHKRSSGGTSVSPKLPLANQIEYGEIAVNYLKDGETLSIKNTNGEIVTFSSDKKTSPTDLMTSITWWDLNELKDDGQLVKGMKYRITDYVTTTAQANTQSANHPFDIIVTALSSSELDENAKAIQHSGDTYFTNSNLKAWELKYCLENETTRFEWVDAINGKGVIYYMKDEFGNECPYDFKNIQFIKRMGFTAFGQMAPNYTTTYSRYETNDTTINTTPYYGFKRIFYVPGPGPMAEYIWTTTTALTPTMSLYTVGGGSVTPVSGTITKVDTENFTSYTFDKNGSEASISGDSESVTENTIASYVNNNIQTLNSIYFRSTDSNLSAYGNNFNVNCHDMTFSHHCYNNTFGINNYGNSFGNSCNYNSFGSGCGDNSFGNECYHNSFGNNCDSNSFGNDCRSNSFGNNCDANSFGNACSSNSFGNYCYSNSFGNDCDDNSFGNECINNSFGNYCDSNSFGNQCNRITFVKDYTTDVIVENGNGYITLTSTQTTSVGNTLRNITIAQGYNNTSTLKTISHNTLKDTFRTTYGNLIPQITYSELCSLKSNSNLTPGQSYRITDYVTTTIQADTQSANHAFDVIVTALSSSELDENARAIQHSGDTYFANSNLNAWELKYSLWNDTNRFAWAVESNGKGVIYYMKDEFGNECPYDFKNIQYVVGNESYYTFDQTLVDGSLNGYANNVYGNVIKERTNGSNQKELNKIYFHNTTNGALAAYNNKFGVGCANISFGNTCHSNTFGAYCYDITFSDGNGNNTFGNECENNTLGFNCSYNAFGDYCSGNTLRSGCTYNSFGNECSDNSFGDSCNGNSFGNYCESISFGNRCNGNSFGNSCNDNSFGSGCSVNSFGNGCNYDSFGNDCNRNSFGNECQDSSFSNSSNDNSFGNGCESISFGNSCNDNSFGNGCIDINCSGASICLTVESGVRYVEIVNGGGSVAPIYNLKLSSGLCGTSTTKKTVIIPQRLIAEATKIIYADGSLWVDGVKQTT